MKYAGCTNDPNGLRQEYGNPKDFRIMCTFGREIDSRKWEREMRAKGYRCGTRGEGWKYGCVFSK